MPDIFISYRREDTVAHAGRLFDRLAAHFGKEHVFMDIDTIKPGEDFVEVLEKTVGECDTFIALVGRQWLFSADEHGRRRLDLSGDYLRREVEIALDRNIRIIPVLVQGALMPGPDELPQAISGLARRQAFHLPDLGFHCAVDELIAALESVSQRPKTVGPGRLVAKRSGQPRTPDANTLRIHLPDSKIRRLFLLYRPPKVYGWLLRIYFIVACVSAPVFLLTSVLLRSQGFR